MSVEHFRKSVGGLCRASVLVVWVVLAVLTAGCAFIKPQTRLRAGWYEFFDTKDQDLQINLEGFEYNADTKAAKADKFTATIKSSASSVIEKNVQQMLAFTEQQRAANEGIAEARQLLAVVMPAVQAYIERMPAATTSSTHGDISTRWGDATFNTTKSSTTQPCGE